jgi:hypothetical protein
VRAVLTNAVISDLLDTLDKPPQSPVVDS